MEERGRPGGPPWWPGGPPWPGGPSWWTRPDEDAGSRWPWRSTLLLTVFVLVGTNAAAGLQEGEHASLDLFARLLLLLGSGLLLWRQRYPVLVVFGTAAAAMVYLGAGYPYGPVFLIRSGASGFLVKDTEPEELVRAVRAVVEGDALLSPGVTRRLISEFAARSKEPAAAASLTELTEREREVMALVGIGLSNEEIARRLVVSPLTAKTHVSRTMVKLGARDRAQLVVLAYESGLVRPGWLG